MIGGVDSAVIDEVGSKLLIAGQNGPQSVVLLRCNLDGTQCTPVTLTSERALGHPTLLVDAVHGKLLLVVDVSSTQSRELGMFRCELDSTGCSYVTLHALSSSDTGFEAALLDKEGGEGKLLLVRRDQLTRCELDGSQCSQVDLSPPGGSSLAVIDRVGRKLLIAATESVDGGFRNVLTRCELDGSQCTAVRPFVDHLESETLLLVDDVNGQLLMAGVLAGRPVLRRCRLDLGSCTQQDLEFGVGAGDDFGPAIVDRAHGKLRIYSGRYGFELKLQTCELDGTACATRAMPFGKYTIFKIMLIAPPNRLLLLGEGDCRICVGTPVLFTMDLP